MKSYRTENLAADAAGVARAAALLAAGECVAFPTETVYGLGADARNGAAVARVYAAKGRPAFNPLIAHVADAEAARSLVIWSDMATHLAQTMWPGPLTLVLPLRPGHGIASLVTAGLTSLGVRVPAEGVAQRLLRAFGGPVAAPSANPSGRISPTQASHVRARLDGKIAAILDGGACDVGIESTILGLTETARPVLLRPGGVPRETIESALGMALAQPSTGGTVTAPGQLESHYAPSARVRLNATQAQGQEVLLGFGPVAGDLSLSATGDLEEAAAVLFDRLHRLDDTGRPIAVAPIPETGLGAALNDRLRRAAAPRDG
ncbi:MAG: L-threonylcarbamoyladenylate synthase [Pseudomonadota bacterium]